ncbi:MAG: ribosomal protein L7/L12 [Phycisphaerales bacterium]
MPLFSGANDAVLAKLNRLERKVDLLLQAMGVELQENPLSAEIADLMARNRKIEAIKRLRQATGVGLAEAKHAVDTGTWDTLLT